jgi:hypothetical protein
MSCDAVRPAERSNRSRAQAHAIEVARSWAQRKLVPNPRELAITPQHGNDYAACQSKEPTGLLLKTLRQRDIAHRNVYVTVAFSRCSDFILFYAVWRHKESSNRDVFALTRKAQSDTIKIEALLC